MGYFSNGTEGEYYQDEYCLRCAHWSDEGGCPVWDLHMLYNYDQNKDKTLESVLDSLIPRVGIGNAKCRMFLPLVLRGD